MEYFVIPELPDLRFPWYGRMSFDLWRPLRQHVYARDQGLCRYCGKPTESYQCHCHHILALADGGTNHPSNLKTSCPTCHKSKHPWMLDPLARLGAADTASTPKSGEAFDNSPGF